MIASYPHFTPISLDLKNDIDTITHRFEPYSDFSFTSLYCWNTNGSTEASLLHGNLVIRMPDYLTSELIVTFIGSSQIDETVKTLLAHYETINLIPEVTVEHLQVKDDYNILEDRDNHDYIYDLENLTLLPGARYKKKRNKINSVKEALGDQLTLYTTATASTSDKNHIRTILDEWIKHSDQSPEESVAESIAIDTLLEASEYLKLLITIMYRNGTPVAFSINEIINKKFAICHFEKVIQVHDQLGAYVSWQTARQLYERGCAFVNWEQDLGISGLRMSKLSYQPIQFLKKYTITPKTY